MSRSLAGALVLAGALGLGVGLWTPSTPAAALDALAVSQDGESWDHRLERPLFDPRVRWVPGDDRSDSFRVRNQSSHAGVLSISVDADPRERLLVSKDLLLSARVGDADWIPLGRLGKGEGVSETTVDPGDDVTVTVRAELADSADNSAQWESVDLGVTVAQVTAEAEVATDSANAGWLVLAVGVLGGFGTAWLRRRKERA